MQRLAMHVLHAKKIVKNKELGGSYAPHDKYAVQFEEKNMWREFAMHLDATAHN